MALAVTGALAADAGEFKANFSQGKWNAADWTMVRSPRFERLGAFDQKDDHIVNSSDAAWSDEELYAKHVTEVYASMAYAKRLSGTVDVVSTMSFDHLMAPIIVITPDLYPDEKKIGKYMYKEHYEVVLYNAGLNVWHHMYDEKTGKPSWHLAAFARAPFAPKTKYELKVNVAKVAGRKEPRMTVECGNVKFGFEDPNLPTSFYAGITGCEGRNRFYDFAVKASDTVLDPLADGEH